VVRENKLESCYLRPLTWIGDQKLGVSPKGNTIHLMVAAWAWGAYLGEEGLKRGIRVKTSSYTRHHVNITMTQAKAVSNYTNSILANMEATDDGYDEACCSTRRLRQRRRGREHVRHQERRGLHARPVGRRAQRHHAQHRVRICQDLGLELVQKRITRDEVYIATRPSSPAPPPK
jgi:branched-chain amino acid aminotransferase